MRNAMLRLRVPLLALSPFLAIAAWPANAFAQEGQTDTGDTAWMLTSAALVLAMTPALAFFYGGLVRRKNILSVLMQCFIIICIVTIQWVVIGYSLAFGPDIMGFVGGLAWLGLKGVGAAPNTDYAATIPHTVFVFYQCMFAVITPALILGAFAERMKFSTFCMFMLIWATVVYDPICHWVWAVGGFIRNLGALDFAGGTVVHINAGVAALVCALVLGKRQGYPGKISPPHNLPFAVLGAGFLWFGWFGFNAGSALGATGLAGSAFLATHVAAAAAGLTWAILDWRINAHATVLGMITGVVAGLVAITPAAGFVGPIDAIWIGIGAALACYFFVAVVKVKLGYDDSLDVFGVHGIGGMWGALATGLWASTEINPAGANGLFYGNPGLVVNQIVAVLATAIYSAVVTFVVLKVLDAVMGVRVGPEDERIGLDLTQHREAGYTQLD